MLISHGLRAATPKTTDAPYFVSASTTNSPSGLGHTINVPTTRQSGDYLIMFLGVRSNTGATINNPSGWTQLLANATSPITGAYYKVSNGAEASTISVSLNQAAEVSAVVIDIRNYSSTNTIGAWAATDSSSPLTNSGITPTASGLLLAFWGFRASSSTTTVTVTTPPTGMTLAGQAAQNGVTGVAYYQNWAATATGSREVGLSAATILGSHSLLVQLA